MIKIIHDINEKIRDLCLGSLHKVMHSSIGFNDRGIRGALEQPLLACLDRAIGHPYSMLVSS